MKVLISSYSSSGGGVIDESDVIDEAQEDDGFNVLIEDAEVRLLLGVSLVSTSLEVIELIERLVFLFFFVDVHEETVSKPTKRNKKRKRQFFMFLIIKHFVRKKYFWLD